MSNQSPEFPSAPRAAICPAWDSPTCAERLGLTDYCDCVCHRGIFRCTGYRPAPISESSDVR
jgi:hypothetical protein